MRRRVPDLCALWRVRTPQRIMRSVPVHTMRKDGTHGRRMSRARMPPLQTQRPPCGGLLRQARAGWHAAVWLRRPSRLSGLTSVRRHLLHRRHRRHHHRRHRRHRHRRDSHRRHHRRHHHRRHRHHGHRHRRHRRGPGACTRHVDTAAIALGGPATAVIVTAASRRVGVHDARVVPPNIPSGWRDRSPTALRDRFSDFSGGGVGLALAAADIAPRPRGGPCTIHPLAEKTGARRP